MENGYYSSMATAMLKNEPFSEQTKNAMIAAYVIAIADELHEMNKNLEKLINKIEIEEK